jgi:hypothetical protein
VYLINPKQHELTCLVTITYHQQNKCSSDDGTTKKSPPPTKRSKNDKPTNDIETIHDAFDPGDEVSDKGEGKKQQHEYIIDNQTQLGYLPAEPPTDKPTRPSAYGTSLDPPTFQLTGQPMLGKDRTKHTKENKNKHQMTQATQPKTTYWETHKGEVQLLEDMQEQPAYRNEMCPNRLALHYPAAATLKEYATYGCPAKTGKSWMKVEIWEALERGPHASALSAEALEHFKHKAAKKGSNGASHDCGMGHNKG